MVNTYKRDELLKRLAVAMAENPRSTIKELAKSSGVSNATLNRFCGTRKNLERMIIEKANDAMLEIIKIALKDFDDYTIGLHALIDIHYKEHEFLRIAFSIQSNIDEDQWLSYLKSIDTFFLKGQKKGAFRIDFNDSFLSEIFTSSICGLIDAERRGRVAKIGIAESFEDFFLNGAGKTTI